MIDSMNDPLPYRRPGIVVLYDQDYAAAFLFRGHVICKVRSPTRMTMLEAAQKLRTERKARREA